LLYITLADIAAVGHGVLSARKELSVRHLYQLAHQAFAGEHSISTQTHPTPAQRAAQVSIHTDEEQGVSQLVVCVPDSAGLFCAITHALAACQVMVSRAHIRTLDDGTAFDIFVIAEQDGRCIGGFGRLERICLAVHTALQNRHLPRAVLPVGKKKHRRRIVPHVAIDNTLSDSRSVVEITASDKSGLLYTLATTLESHGLSVDSAFINTYGDSAVDVFYIRDEYGDKIEHPQKQQRLINALLLACG
jgi:[protein-PII] uridylyltransferase